MNIKMSPERAKALVHKRLPSYVIEWCVPYKHSYIVMAHPDDGPEDQEHGAYPDPFYAVNKLTGHIRHFLPVAEQDGGRGFFAAVNRELRGSRT